MVTVTSRRHGGGRILAGGAQTGSNVVTTIDIGMQEVAESSLAKYVQEMAEMGKQQNGNDEEAPTAPMRNPVRLWPWMSIAARCSALPTIPPMIPKDYAEKYNELLGGRRSAGQSCAQLCVGSGSTFKMITAVAALRHGISDGFTVNDFGTVYQIPDFPGKCWI